jgi:hypothetical protein
MNNEILIRSHEGGFFSCCSVRLHFLIEYFNHFKKLPLDYDTTGFYTWYKNDNTKDITFDYFNHYNTNNIKIEYKKYIDFKEYYQYKDFNKLDIKLLKPFIDKYYTPTDKIEEIKKTIENKYSIDYDNICVLFYRGNDKATELNLPSFDEYIDNANKILETNSNIKFLIQSDETNFINEMKINFPNHIIFNDEIRHIYKTNTTVDKVFKEYNNEYSSKFLAIILIMSKCKYIICSSGNCSLWIFLYKQNTKNMIELAYVDF